MIHCYYFSQMKILVTKKYKFHGICIDSSKSAVLEEIVEPLMLVFKPANIVDSNKIEIITENKNARIGYVAREKAATLAPSMYKYFQNRKVNLTDTLYDVNNNMSDVINIDFVVKNYKMKSNNVMSNILAKL